MNHLLKQQYPDRDPAPATIVDRLHAARNNLSEVVGRVSHLADRLCGPVPREASGSTENKRAPSSVFDVFEGSADEISHMAMRMHEELARIESRIS